MNYALAFPIPRALADDWLSLRVTDTAVAMSPTVGTGEILFVQWFEGQAGYRWLLRIAASLRETHGLSAVVFKPWAPEVRRLAERLGAKHVSTDGEGEERWLLEGEGAKTWLTTGRPVAGLEVRTVVA